MSYVLTELSDERLRELHEIYHDAVVTFTDQLKQRNFKRKWKMSISAVLDTVKTLLSEVCTEMDNRSPKPLLVDIFSNNKSNTVKS